MCGISGIIAPATIDVGAAVAQMTQRQHHRGPDDHGHAVDAFGDGRVGLGNNRLAIIDLSPTGAQPMYDPATGSVIVYNGEIYNYRELKRDLSANGVVFEGGSDTEVLLKGLLHWGRRCLERLEGMYAFAFYNPKQTSLVLARDPLGIKPLYWTPNEQCLVFASENQGVLASGLISPEINSRALSGLFAYGAFQQPETVYRSVQAFPPGCSVEIRPSSRRIWEASEPQRHWSFPPARSMTKAQAVELTRDVVTKAVTKHLVSDVPIGVFLSSGMDSGIVAALAARARADCTALTVGFEDHADYSEVTLARQTALSIGIKHIPIDVSANEAMSWTADWLTNIDQPALDGLNVFIISKAARRMGFKVALSGQGGDEVFGGYPSFRDIPWLHRLARMSSALPSSVVDTGVACLRGFLPEVRLKKVRDIVHTSSDVDSLYFQRRRLMSDEDLASLGVTLNDRGAARGDASASMDMIKAISELELKYYLGNTLLAAGDVASMANSLELRVPMLDVNLLDTVLAMKGDVRLPPRAPGKYLLREAFGHLLPADVLKQHKRGFVLPQSRWMRTSLRDSCESAIQNVRASGLCDPTGVDRVWQSFIREPESPAWSRAWLLYVIGAWLGSRKSSGQTMRAAS